ncbi:hypothetical protein L207DRAFT_535264 [Hyaloscypha variabilis F]|uniref:Uncharacterized protein n=1 Tax=Hyaloscypha variabilis (strain UAMH 11265 / GT02V1 / F) TaxID=1149755 RepID=A0A2J6R409_HYAVF|nr:hypothetical protein L207DRAFT_535264 [Hyaloscypha variabilis F]
MTNKGISISLALISRTEASEAGVQVENYPNVPDDDDDGVSQIFAPLNCGISRSPGSEQLQILLYLLQGTFDTGDRWYMRPNVSQLATLPLPALQIRPERKQILIFFSQNNLSVTTPTPPGSHFTIQAKLGFHISYTALAVSNTSVENTSNKVEDISIYQRRRIEVDPEGVLIYDAIFGSESRDFIEFQGPRGPDGVFEAFILQIDYTLYRWGQTGITLLLPSGSSTDELDRLISAAKTRPCSPCDRASITLPSGCQVYAAFRKWIRAGELAYRIDLNVGVPKGGPKGEKDAPNGSHEVFQDRAQ